MKIQFYFNLNSEPYDVILPISFGDRVDGVADTLSFEFLANEDLLNTYKKYQKCKLDIKDDENNLIREFKMCITDINRDLNTTAYENNAPKYTYTVTIAEPSVLIQKNNRTDIAITPFLYGKTNGKYPYETLFDAYLKVMSCHNLNARNEPIYNNYMREYVSETNNTFFETSHIPLPRKNIKGNINVSHIINTAGKIDGSLVFTADGQSTNVISLGGHLYSCTSTITYNNVTLPASKTVTFFNIDTEEDEVFTLICDALHNFSLSEYPDDDISPWINTSNITFDDDTYYVPNGGGINVDTTWFPIEVSFFVYKSETYIIQNLYDTITITLSYNSTTGEIIPSYSSQQNQTYQTLGLVYNLQLSRFNDEGKKLYDSLSSVPCPTITYQDLSTFSQLQDLFGRVGMIPYLTFNDNGFCYMDAYYAQGDFKGEKPSTLEYFTSEEACKLDDSHSTTISTQVKNMVCDNDTITYPARYEEVLRKNNYSNEIYTTFSSEFDNFEDFQSGAINTEDYIENASTLVEITMAVPDNYNSLANKIESANSYGVTLPSNIENILYVYRIEDASDSQNPRKIKLSKLYDSEDAVYSIKNVIEYSEYTKLSDTQKRYFAYFVRGENRLNQVVSLIASVQNLKQDYPWDKDDLYYAVRKCRLCVVYKPMVNSEYTYYNYDNINSKTTEYINTPYKLVSDKQLASILGYEFYKRDSANISFKIITTDVNELSHYAGERVFLKEHKLFDNWNILSENFYGKDYVSTYTGSSFATLSQLNTAYYNIISNQNAKDWFAENGYNVWCYVGEDVYTINKETNKWEKYLGELCVITKMSVSIDNNTIEITYDLSNKIANNSTYSNYSDNIRVSDNLSTSNVVTRNVMINKAFLLNCHAYTTSENNINLYPSIDKNVNNKPYFDGYDKYLYSNGMLKLGFNGSYNPNSGYGEVISNVSKLKKLSTNISYITTLSQFGSWNTSSGYVSSTTKYKNKNKLADGQLSVGMGASFSFDSSTGVLTGNGLLSLDRIYIGMINWSEKYMYPDVGEIISIITDTTTSHYFRYKSRPVGIGYKIDFQHSTSSNFAQYETLKSWDISNNPFISSFKLSVHRNVTSVVGVNPDDGKINEAVLNSNGLSVKSCNLFSYIFSFPATCLGSSAYGLTDKNSNHDMFDYTKPLFYNRSGDLSRLHSISSLEDNITMFKFEKIVKDYGFNDLLVDIREKINVIIQYIVLPANTFDFYTKYNYWNREEYFSGTLTTLFPNRGSTGIKAEEKTLEIVEINTNVDFLDDAISNDSDLPSNAMYLYKVPKGATIGDFIKDSSIGTLFVSCSATQEKFSNDISIPKLTLFTYPLEASDEFNYLLTNNNRVPLMIISASGIESTSTICFDSILI